MVSWLVGWVIWGSLGKDGCPHAGRLTLLSTPITHHHPQTDQRALGFSMRVERVGVDKVKERLQSLKQKEEAAKTAVRWLLVAGNQAARARGARG